MAWFPRSLSSILMASKEWIGPSEKTNFLHSAHCALHAQHWRRGSWGSTMERMNFKNRVILSNTGAQ